MDVWGLSQNQTGGPVGGSPPEEGASAGIGAGQKVNSTWVETTVPGSSYM